jgi:adenine-specific DNA-methyltransferase
MGDHAYTHCKVRLDKVVDGTDQGGISKAVDWKGGGGYRFYELAPTLVKKDNFGQHVINPEYNPEMLASAVAKHEGYIYNPHEDISEIYDDKYDDILKECEEFKKMLKKI